MVLESPGSIAELGLFSVIEEFKKKLLVFIETDHYQSTSFIRLGPVDYLEKFCHNAAECHRWMTDFGPRSAFDPTAAENLQPDFAEAIRRRASQPMPERPLNLTGWLDCALLACDLLGLCSALTVRELCGLMADLGCDRPESEIKQLMFLLERVGLLVMEPKGDQRFYVSVDSCEHVRFRFRDPHFDVMRFRTDVLRHYEANDKRRFRAIQEVRKRHAKSS